MVISTIYYFQFSRKSKWETILWKTSCSLTALIIVINIFGYWGMPCSIAHIWFWSLPVICVLILFYYFFHKHKYTLFTLLLICSACTLVDQLGLVYYDNECVGVVSGRKDTPGDGVSLCTLKNITNDGSLAFIEDARNDIVMETVMKKWIISLVSTPSLNPEWLKQNAISGEYYLFAEHDNMTLFIGPESPFNDDSFRRKSPWSVYKPVMNPALSKSSENDILYCSNIGCTLKKDLRCYPLVWVYTRSGIPVLLAKGEFIKGMRFTYIGDSDPMCDFLAPYNPFWFRSLLGKPNYYEIISAILILVLSIYVIQGGIAHHKIRLYVLPLLVLAFCIIDRLSCDITPVVDVSISATDKWLSPHYPSNFSSFPKNLIQNNLTVAVERKESISKIDIKIVNKRNYKIRSVDNSDKYYKRFIVLLPGTSVIAPNGKIIVADDVPLGKKVIELEPLKKLVIDDARNLFVDGNLISKMFITYGNIYIMASGSPQRIEGIHDFIHTK